MESDNSDVSLRKKQWNLKMLRICFFKKFDVWTVHRDSGKVDVLLPPKSISKYTQLFDDLGIKYTVLESNIQK